LHIAQPSLSRQIRDLEAELGVRLFNRTGQGVNLTEAGKSFLADASRVVQHGDEIIRSVRAFDQKEKTPALRIGYVATLVYDLLPASIAAFQASFPRIAVHLFDMMCAEQLSALVEGQIDLAFVGSPEVKVRRGIRCRPLREYKTVAALPKKSPLARRSTVRIKDLQPMFFVGISEQSRPGYRKWLIENCAKAGYQPKILQEVALERPVLHAVGSGLGVALPEPATKLPHDNVVFRPIKPPIVTPFWVAWREDNKFPAIEAYVKVLEDYEKRTQPL
jgi:DNA-binding transcriptional LysR family regulator